MHRNEGEEHEPSNIISSPLPSFPNKQSTLKNQNLIKVGTPAELENVELESDDSQNKNSLTSDPNPDSEFATRERRSDVRGTAGIQKLQSEDIHPEEEKQFHTEPNNAASGDIKSMILGFFNYGAGEVNVKSKERTSDVNTPKYDEHDLDDQEGEWGHMGGVSII